MGEIREPYAKEKNLIQLSLFYFGKKRPIPKETMTEWADKNGTYKLGCCCRYGVPGAFEQDVYAACMRAWVIQGMPEDGIVVSYADIARQLHLAPPRAWSGKIKKALKKLGQARYEFFQCFVLSEEQRVTDTDFSLFDSASHFQWMKVDGKYRRESHLLFSKEIKKNLEAKYYQWLDMAWYRALPSGLPRRLYEYLEKRRYHNINGEFIISEEALCRWLPIKDKHTTRRRKRLADIARMLIKKGFLAAYSFDRKKRQCHFRYAKPAPPMDAPVSEPSLAMNTAPSEPVLAVDAVVSASMANAAIEPLPATAPKSTERSEPECEVQEKAPAEQQALFVEALNWIDTIPYFHRKRRDEIAALPFQQVAEYYPSIRQKYDELSKAGKRPKPGWVYAAFKEQYVFADKAEEEAKARRLRQRQAKIQAVKAYVEALGGCDNVLFDEKRVYGLEDAGLLIDGGVVVWQEVRIELFSAIDAPDG